MISTLYYHFCMKWRVSPLVVSDSLQPCGLKTARLLYLWDFPDKDTGVVCYFLLEGNFPNSDQTWISCTADRFFTDWATREAQNFVWFFIKKHLANIIIVFAYECISLWYCMILQTRDDISRSYNHTLNPHQQFELGYLCMCI